MGEEYATGLDSFVKMARQKHGSVRNVRCPCRVCRNVLYQSLNVVKNHLLDKGMDLTYTTWRFHGEDEKGDISYEDDDDDV